MVHPPPINYLIVLLLPSLFKKSNMARSSEIFSKFIFWLENIFYLTSMMLYLLLLVPIIYLKLMINILRAESLFRAIGLTIGWILCGPFYLLFYVLVDLFNFLKILYDYKEEGDEDIIKAREDEMQDQIVIYNEIVDTLRAIMNIFRHYKKVLKLKQKTKKNSPRGKKVH